MKKLLALSLVGLLIISGCNKKEEPPKEEPKQPEVEGPQINDKEDVINDKTLEEFTFTNTSMVYENGTTTLETTVTNTSNATSFLQEFLIHVKDEDGKEIVTLKGFVGDNIPAGESKVITSGASANLTNAHSISYEVVR